MTLHQRDDAAIMPTYRRLGLEIEHGQGAYLVDKSGTRFLDLFGGLAVNLLGYGHPRVIAAVTRQLQRYMHLSNYFVQDSQVQLAELLSERGGYARTFFCNSGTEAAEAAVKLARKWGSTRGKSMLVGFSGAFHGRTMSPLSIMSHAPYRDGFGPFLEPATHLPWNDAAALESAIDESTCAVFLEFIQGEGGVVPAAPAFIDTLARLRDRFGFLIVADEVQCGIGRTGTFFGFEHWTLRPDLVMIAKGLGGGLPLGALLSGEELGSIFGHGGHGSTFGGNPVACAAGVAVIDTIVQDGLLDRASRVGSMIISSMNSLKNERPDLIDDVRGRGCMIGIELASPASGVMKRCLDRGLLVNVTRERIIRLLPPLILSDEQTAHAMHLLRSAILDNGVAA